MLSRIGVSLGTENSTRHEPDVGFGEIGDSANPVGRGRSASTVEVTATVTESMAGPAEPACRL